MQNVPPEPYRYWFQIVGSELYNFKDKELCQRHYITYMLLRTQKIFEYKNLPDTIPKRMLESMLQVNGFVCVAKHSGDLYAFWGGLGGEPDAYYQPTICVVANPFLKLNKEYKIGKDCVIIRNDTHYYGLMPLFRRYATALVENDLSFRLASINTRIQSIMTAPDQPTTEACEEYLSSVEAGDLGVIQANEFLEGVKVQNASTALRTFTDLIEYQQYLKASWFNEIGLNANYNMKREKLSTTESQMNNDALLPLVDEMLESRREGIKLVNEMFGTNIEVSFASSWEKLVEEFQAQIDDLKMGDVGSGTGTNEEQSNQLDRGEDNGESRTSDTSGAPDSQVQISDDERGRNGMVSSDSEGKVEDDSGKSDADSSGVSGDVQTSEMQREDGASETTDDNGVAGDGNGETSEEVSDSDDGVTVNVEVEVNVEGGDEDAESEGQTESPESVRDNESVQ